MSSRCSVCSLPTVVRRECEDRLQRRGLSLRAVAAYATDLGHPTNKDSLATHLRHVAVVHEGHDEAQAGPSSALVALAARDVFEAWPSLLDRLVQRLHTDGFHDEAEIVGADLAHETNAALATLRPTEVGAVFAARVLAACCGFVLPNHPDVCREMSEQMRRLNAEELAVDFEWLATKHNSPGHDFSVGQTSRGEAE